MAIEDGEAVHYTAVPKGAAVWSSDEVEVGTVEAMLDNYREHIFDGVVFRDRDGGLRFADAPEVARTAERGVTLAIDAEAAGRLPEPDRSQVPSSIPGVGGGGGGLLGRLFGGRER